MDDLDEILARLVDRYRAALRWFAETTGTEQPWLDPMGPEGNGKTPLASEAKGIYEPSWSPYALSVRQSQGGPYPDRDPIVREAPMPDALTEKKTLWERAAETRWGAYLTEQQREALLLAASVPGEPGVSVEVGCEGGRWSRLLHDAGWRVVCTDVDPETLALCARRIPTATCILVQPRDSTIPVETASARLLLVSEVAPVSQSEWFPDEAGRVVEAGGLLLCTFYNPTSPRGIAYRVLRRIEAWRSGSGGHFHEHFYGGASYALFRKRLQRQGFRLLHEKGLCWFPFSRQSNSGLVPLCTRLEGLLGLRRLVTVSPFVIVVAQKPAVPPGSAVAGPLRLEVASRALLAP